MILFNKIFVWEYKLDLLFAIFITNEKTCNLSQLQVLNMIVFLKLTQIAIIANCPSLLSEKANLNPLQVHFH